MAQGEDRRILPIDFGRAVGVSKKTAQRWLRPYGAHRDAQDRFPVSVLREVARVNGRDFDPGRVPEHKPVRLPARPSPAPPEAGAAALQLARLAEGARARDERLLRALEEQNRLLGEIRDALRAQAPAPGPVRRLWDRLRG